MYQAAFFCPLKTCRGAQARRGALCAEVPPSTGYYDLTHKKRVYEAHGVREYWVVDSGEHTVVVYQNQESRFQEAGRPDEGEGAVPSRLLEGFAVRLQDMPPREF